MPATFPLKSYIAEALSPIRTPPRKDAIGVKFVILKPYFWDCITLE